MSFIVNRRCCGGNRSSVRTFQPTQTISVNPYAQMRSTVTAGTATASTTSSASNSCSNCHGCHSGCSCRNSCAHFGCRSLLCNGRVFPNLVSRSCNSGCCGCESGGCDVQALGYFVQTQSMSVPQGRAVSFEDGAITTPIIYQENGQVILGESGVYLVTYLINIPEDGGADTVFSLQLNGVNVEGGQVAVNSLPGAPATAAAQVIVPVTTGDAVLTIVSSNAVQLWSANQTTVASLTVLRLSSEV